VQVAGHIDKPRATRALDPPRAQPRAREVAARGLLDLPRGLTATTEARRCKARDH